MHFNSLYRFIVQKLFIGLISELSVVLLISLIIYLSPVDPAAIQFGQRSDPESIELLKRKFFLDKSYAEQIYRYFEDLSILQFVKSDDLRLDEYHFICIYSFEGSYFILKYPYLRRSFTSGERVSEMILSVLPATAILAMSALFISITLGLLLGILSALYYSSWIDHLISAFSILCYAIPSYISAILFSLIFGYTLHSLTGLPVQGSLFNLDDYGNEYFDFKYLILPSIALGIRPIAMISQMTRASLLENFSKDYVRTAVAMGLSSKRLLIKHIFPNAWSPIITTVSGWFASLLTGAFFVEYVFNYRGLGDLTIQSLAQFDLPVILACCITTICIFVLINTLADIINAAVDPRIKI